MNRSQLQFPVLLSLVSFSLAGDTPRFGMQACLSRPDYGLKALKGDGLGFGIHGLLRLNAQQQVRLRLDHLTFPATDFPTSKPPSRVLLQGTALGLEGLFAPLVQQPHFYTLAGIAAHRWTVEARTAADTPRESVTRLGIGLGVGWQFSPNLGAEARYVILGAAVVPGTNPAWSAFTTMNTTQIGLTWTF